ncbi:hypothetical protein quinque_010531 [Culex quinquefasciatus]
MTDSESHSLSEKGSRNSATFSIHSLDDVPVRKSAVQIIRERSTDMFHHPPGSPRKQRATMQITKLVLKDPPTSPSRRKITPVVIKSIQTYTSSALTNCGQENRKIAAGESRHPEEEFKIIPLLNADQLMEQFEAQKNERNAASSDFQSYLVESFNKENKERAAIQISKISTPNVGSAANLITAPQENQGKSDSSSSAASKTVNSSATSSSTAATAPSGTGKSSSTTTTTSSSASSEQPPPPPSVPEKMPPKPPSVRRTARPRTQPEPAVPEARKEKSYDPQRAREYIKEQQAKRKQEKRSSGPPASEKELIRKRLDDLRKNTQVLVNKNVQKARKRSLSATPAAASGSSQKSGTPLRALDSGGRGMPPQKPLRKSVSTSSLKAVDLPAATSSVKSSSAASSRRRSSLLKADLSEKMGIMRKPEEVPLGDVLVSPLRMVTPPSPPKFEQRVDELGKRLMETQEQGDQSRSFLELEKELKLEVPEVTLVPDSIIKRTAPVSNEPVDRKKEQKEQQPSKPIPPWLKHTLIQPDPYPFIVAVRKKLEAACNRPDELPVTGKSRASKSSKRCDEYLKTLKSVPYIRKPSKAGGRDETPHNISSISHQSSVPNTTSDISSIRSDFVLSLPPLSSTKIDTNATSNSVHQPQVVSPLSVERISSLKITAADSSLEKVNFTRGDDMPNADLIPDRVSFSARHVVDLDQSQISVNTSEKQRNFLHNSSQAENTTHEYQRMLEAFNRSLSQVIEVNQQLYSTLSVKIRDEMTQTTPVPATSAVSTTANGSSSNYTDDFERSGAAVQKSDSTSSADSTPQKSSFTTTTAPTTTSSSSSGDSPDSKTNSSESEQLLLDSRSFASLSDSHNTNPPMPEEYLPSFEESLRRQEVVAAVADKSDEPASTTEKGVYSSSSIATQISDEVREEVRAVNSVESISMKFSVGSDVANEEVSPKVEMLKKPATSSSSSSEMEALNARVADSEREEDHRMNDTTMGSDILAMFNRTDLEISVMSTTVSEANLSYSSIGLYDQLIQSEKSKTDQLASRARLKEKALLDRTKGQLAWLELQKQRYRERGMLEQISTTKKKQRAILVRLERERAELNRFKKAASEVPLRSVGSRSPHRSIEKLNSFSSASNSISLRKSAAGSGRSEIGSPQLQRKLTATTTTTTTTMLAAVRGVELEPSGSLENILQRREQELQKRREHVQALLEWHRKLDQEEQQIREIEQNLLRYNRDKVEVGSKSNDTSVAALGRIRSIEASLQTLQQIPDDQHEQQQQRRDSTDEEVQASGGKLNRLWYRLTGVKEARYDTARSYTLTKASLERLYEEAKAKVLEGFRGGTTLLDQSLSGINSTQGSVGNVSVIERKEEGEVEVVNSDASSLKTTSEVLVAEKELESSQQEASSVNGEVIEEELPDVDEIISRVSDITDNMKDLLSSTTKLDDMLQNQQDKPASESVEFHTTIDEGEEERDSTGQNNYSTSFDASTIEELPRQVIEVAVPTNDSQLMIEDTSLPAGILDDSIAESIPEVSDKITPALEASLEEASSTASSVTTPTTAEETETEYNEVASPAPPVVASELEKRLVQLNDKLGELSDSFERVPLMRSPDRQIASDSSEPASSSTVEEDLLGNTLNQKPESPPEAPKIEIKIRTKTVNDTFPNLAAPPPASPPSSPTSAPPVFSPTATSTNRMPDIINEAEVLRRQELQIEQEIKQLEQQVVFLREIPNKPPPPYIPPANGSPLALIFPTEQRIDELIEDRTRHLFHSSDDTPPLSSDHVTNIYEKLVLDMCGELFTDLRAPTPDVSFRTVRHDKRPLAFFNPPNALGCLQHHMKRKVKKILNEETLAQQQQQNLHHCPMPYLGMAAPGIGGAKRKRDQVDEILAQEMCDEEPRWTNFDREEIEVKERIVEELTKMLVADALQDMEGAWREREQSSTASMEET